MSPGPEADAPLPPEAFEPLLTDAGRRLGVEISGPVLSGSATYLSELDHWRRRVNLTGRLLAVGLSEHVAESILGADLIAHGARVVDVGSGAGLPGLPLAIARPDLGMTLVEPRQKRATFLRHIARTLGLAHVRVAESRIQDVAGTFGVATTRAVGSFGDWLDEPDFLDADGLVVAWTTDSSGTALGPSFRLEKAVSVPGSRERRIAAFRRIA